MNWDYLAGFIDGEGTITFWRYRSPKGTSCLLPYLIVYQKDPAPLRAIRDFLGVGNLRENGPINRYELRGRALLPVLRELSPRLLVKQRQANALIEFIECRTRLAGKPYDDHCLALDPQMREWNRRGNSGAHNSWQPLEELQQYDLALQSNSHSQEDTS